MPATILAERSSCTANGWVPGSTDAALPAIACHDQHSNKNSGKMRKEWIHRLIIFRVFFSIPNMDFFDFLVSGESGSHL